MRRERAANERVRLRTRDIPAKALRQVLVHERQVQRSRDLARRDDGVGSDADRTVCANELEVEVHPEIVAHAEAVVKKPADRLAADTLILAGIVASIGIGSCVSCSTRPAEAQDAPTLVEHIEVALARFVCAEADAEPPDSAALLWTMRHRAERLGMALVDVVERYSIPLRRAPRTERARAMQALPTSFPTRAYERVVWPRAVAVVRAFLAGEIADPCAEPAVHFGGFSDGSLWRQPAGWRVVDCGPTRNTFFAVSAR